MWLRKSVEKLTGSSRGFSSVIGTIFMVLLVVTSIAGVFLSTLYQNTLYNYAVRLQNQQELDARNENVVANGNYNVSGGKVNVVANLTNAGPVTAQIVNLWVFDTSRQTYGFNNSVGSKPWANYSWSTLKSGQVLNFTTIKPPYAPKVTVPSAVLGDSFSIWFVTARGNTVPLTRTVPVQTSKLQWANVSQGIGSMALDFSSFRFFTYATSTKLASYPGGTKSFTIPGQATPIAFGANLTNLDPRNKTITLNKYSDIWLMFPAVPGQAPQFFIVNVASDGTITTPYSPITFAFGETKLIVFASSSSSSFSQSFIPPPLTPNPAAVNLLLLGTIGTRDYGQNIPFVSLYVYKP
jgi:hypothetical protein